MPLVCQMRSLDLREHEMCKILINCNNTQIRIRKSVALAMKICNQIEWHVACYNICCCCACASGT